MGIGGTTRALYTALWILEASERVFWNKDLGCAEIPHPVLERLGGGRQSESVSFTSRSLLRSSASWRWDRNLFPSSSRRLASATSMAKYRSFQVSWSSSSPNMYRWVSLGYLWLHRTIHKSYVSHCKCGEDSSIRSSCSAVHLSRIGFARSNVISEPRLHIESTCATATLWHR